MGVAGGEDGGGAGQTGGEAHRAEVEHLGPLDETHIHLVGGEIAVRPPQELEGALPLGGEGDHRHGGGSGVGEQAGGVYPVFHQNLPQVAAKAVCAHFAQKSGLSAQTGGGHRHIGGRASGVGGKGGDPLAVAASLGQVDQNFSNSGDITHDGTAPLQKY